MRETQLGIKEMHDPQRSYQPIIVQQPASKSHRGIWIMLGILVGVLVVLMGGCGVAIVAMLGSAGSGPQGQVTNVNSEDTSKFINGEMDYGFNVTATVKNVGQVGTTEVVAHLRCDQGEWTRSQEMKLDAGESRTSTWFFQEPDFPATGCKAWADASP